MQLRWTAVGLAVVATGIAAPVASAETITALGTAQVDVKPSDPNDNKSIVDAVEAAHKLALPRAIREAREEAEAIAAASNLTVGAIDTVDETAFGGGPGYYGPGYGPYGAIAPFGPDQYCGTTTRRVRTRTKSGKVVTRRVKRRRCFVPDRLVTTLSVTFRAAPAG
jgi:hypothetical protein